MRRAICYLPQSYPQDLDHLLPLAIELNLPVITRCEKKLELGRRYYPEANLKWSPPSLPIEELSSKPVVISTLPRYELELELFLESALYGPFESIYCHHGLSDKQLLGNRYKNLESDQKVLIYGAKTKEEIPAHCSSFCVGNYRKHHFDRLKDLYSSKIEPSLGKLQKGLWTVLFAPSWPKKNGENGPFLEEFKSLLESSFSNKIPSSIQVIFKPHPYLLQQIPETLEKIRKAAQKESNLLYLEEIPYIYPLFEKVDAYLGETSSIGYDFLTTGKPFFSLSKELDSSWQRVAIKAPLVNREIKWDIMREHAKSWEPASAHSLEKTGFADVGPLCGLKESFFDFIQ